MVTILPALLRAAQSAAHRLSCSVDAGYIRCDMGIRNR
jgi:hypothetical protein